MSDLVLIEPVDGSIDTTDGAVAVREITLGGTPRGLVVLVHESTTPDVEVVEVLNHLAAEGYESLALVDHGWSPTDVFRRADERGWEPGQIGMVGFGHGGTRVLDAARAHRFGAAVSFSPRPDLDAIRRDPVLRTAWLGMFGAAGLAGEVGALELAELLRDGSDVFSQVVRYEGAGRDLHRSAGSGASYAAAYDSWQRTTEWLNARVETRPTPLALAWRERLSAAHG